MRYFLSVFAWAVLSIGATSVAQAEAAQPLNLSFEDTAAQNALPKNWGSYGPGFLVGGDSGHGIDGSWAGLIAATDQHQEFGTMTQCIAAAPFNQGTIRFWGYLRSAGVTSGWGGLWLRADDTQGHTIAFDNMEDRGVTGTTAWQIYSIQLPVPPTATRICFGFLLAGNGTLWADALNLTSSPN